MTTPRRSLVLVAAFALFFGAFAAFGDLPVSGALIGTGIVAGSAALALVLRRWMDRSVARSLSRAGPPGSPSAAVEVSSYRPYRSWSVIGTATTALAGDVGRFTLHDARRRTGLRLLKRLGLGHRLALDDEEFNDEVYVKRNPEIGATLFASAECREAARAIFSMGFFAIDYRHGLVQAFCHGEVPNETAVAIRPHLLALARNAGVAGSEPRRPDFAASRASASAGGTVQTQEDRRIPSHLLVLDIVGCVLIALGVATQLEAIDIIPSEFRFRGDGMTFIVAGMVFMTPALIRVIAKVRSRT